MDYEQLEKQLKNLDIGVFMNFVGVSYPLPQKLHDLDKMYENLSWEHINVNLMSATNLSRIILPGTFLAIKTTFVDIILTLVSLK